MCFRPSRSHERWQATGWEICSGPFLLNGESKPRELLLHHYRSPVRRRGVILLQNHRGQGLEVQLFYHVSVHITSCFCDRQVISSQWVKGWNKIKWWFVMIRNSSVQTNHKFMNFFWKNPKSICWLISPYKNPFFQNLEASKWYRSFPLTLLCNPFTFGQFLALDVQVMRPPKRALQGSDRNCRWQGPPKKG